jgi:adenylate kinase
VRLVLVGPPGAGKGTQAEFIAAHLAVPKISTGDIFRANVGQGTPLGVEAKRYMDAGQLVPDEVTINMVSDRLAEGDAADGFLLDGFPRTVPQAEALGELLSRRNRALERVIQLDVARSLLEERLVNRRTDKETGQIYHLVYNPPPPGAAIEHRADDRPEAVGKRLDAYETMTAALLPYYDGKGLLRRVDGVGKPDEVTARVLTALGRS